MVEEPKEIEARRIAAGVSKTALAERAGVHRVSYQKIVRADAATVSTMKRLGSALSALIEEKRNG